MADQRACVVSFLDGEGIKHTVEVQAASMFEAAALGFAAFQKAAFLDYPPGIATVIEVSVNQPVVTHQVTVKKLETWLSSGSEWPSEHAVKARLREMLGDKSPAT